MTRQTHLHRRLAIPSASSKFVGFKPDSDGTPSVRKSGIKQTPGLRNLQIALEEFASRNRTVTTYLDACNLLRKFAYDSIDIANLVISLDRQIVCGKYSIPPDEFGYFLSAVVEVCPSNDFVIDLSVFGIIDKLAYHNIKNLRVFGDVGMDFCREMRSGLVELHGNAGNQLAYGMAGGTIIVHGNAGNVIGAGMTGGEVHLNGKEHGAVLWSRENGGAVYHKGELLSFGSGADEF